MIPPASNSSGQPDPAAAERSAAMRAWAHGWAISRGTPAPAQCPGYWRIFVGKPEQTTRYILPRLDPELLRGLLATEAAPGAWLKIAAPLASVAPLLPSSWDIHAPEFLMSTKLAGGAAPVMAGYRLHIESVGSLVLARLVSDTGELAASGQAAVDGLFASFDQIVTAEAHRRKGLGRGIMAALSKGALDLGARQGVLVATEAGAALYQALGWFMVAPVTAASLRQAAH